MRWATPTCCKISIERRVNTIARLPSPRNCAYHHLSDAAGIGARAGTTDLVRSWIAEHRPGAQVEVHVGAQPLYPYLFGVE